MKLQSLRAVAAFLGVLAGTIQVVTAVNEQTFLGIVAPAPAPAPGPGGPSNEPPDNFADELIDQATKPGEDTFTEVCQSTGGCKENCMQILAWKSYCKKVADPSFFTGMRRPAHEYTYKCLKGGASAKGETVPYLFDGRHDQGANCEERCTVYAHDSSSLMCICDAAYEGISKSQLEYDNHCLLNTSFATVAKGFDIWAMAAKYEFEAQNPYTAFETSDLMNTGKDGSGGDRNAFLSKCHAFDADGDGKISYKEYTGKHHARCVDLNNDDVISFDECVGINFKGEGFFAARECERCSHNKKRYPDAEENTELTADEASQCLDQPPRYPCMNLVMPYPDFQCMDADHNNRVTQDECKEKGAQLDSMPVKKRNEIEHDKTKLMEWADEYYEKKREEAAKKAKALLLIQAPAPAPGPGPAPGPPPRPEAYFECIYSNIDQKKIVEGWAWVEAQQWPAFAAPPAAPAAPAPPAAPGAPAAPEGPAPPGTGGLKPSAPATARQPIPMPNPMDYNHDGRVSQQEAYDYAVEMPGADINAVTMRKLFKSADTNRDKYLDHQEFHDAGMNHKGDGPKQ